LCGGVAHSSLESVDIVVVCCFGKIQR